MLVPCFANQEENFSFPLLSLKDYKRTHLISFNQNKHTTLTQDPQLPTLNYSHSNQQITPTTMYFRSLFLIPLLLASVFTANGKAVPTTEKCLLNSVCFVLDRSGSVRRFYNDIQTFTVNAAKEIGSRTTGTTYSAYGFNTRSFEIQAPSADLDSVFIPSIQAPVSPGGNTRIRSGFESCFNVVKDESGNRVIVIVTDGQDNGSASDLLPQILAEDISVVTVGIGSGVNVEHLQSLATTPDFYVQATQANLVANAASVVDKSCVVPEAGPSPEVTPMPSECQNAYDECQFMFKGQADVPVYSVTGPPDRPFTDTIVSRTNPEVGVLNTNGIVAEFIMEDGSATEITQIAQPKFTSTHFKPLSRQSNPIMSGVGHQTFHGNQATVAQNKCVRLFFTSFQTISHGPNPRVLDNVNSEKGDNTCVVFKTV